MIWAVPVKRMQIWFATFFPSNKSLDVTVNPSHRWPGWTLKVCLLLLRSRRPWRLQVNPTCSPACRTLGPVTWSNRLTRRTPEPPCGAPNQRNVSTDPGCSTHSIPHLPSSLCVVHAQWPLCGGGILPLTLLPRRIPGRRCWTSWRSI